MDLSSYIKNCYRELPSLKEYKTPWEIINNLNQLIELISQKLPKDAFTISNGVAIHNTAIIEDNVTIKKNTIIGEKCYIKSGAYIRGGAYIGKEVNIGANCEVKQCIVFNGSKIAHLNYLGNSIIGENVNLEAGSILANHFNEFKNKKIEVVINGSIVGTNMLKFGSLIGDESRIGANSVLNPGTILEKKSIIGRLAHIDQLQIKNR